MTRLSDTFCALRDILSCS